MGDGHDKRPTGKPPKSANPHRPVDFAETEAGKRQHAGEAKRPPISYLDAMCGGHCLTDEDVYGELDTKLQEQKRVARTAKQFAAQKPKEPWYRTDGRKWLTRKASSWDKTERDEAVLLLDWWYAQKDAGISDAKIRDSIIAYLSAHLEAWLRAIDSVNQKECKRNPPSGFAKAWGDPCTPLFAHRGSPGYHTLSFFRARLRLNTRDAAFEQIDRWYFWLRLEKNPMRRLRAQATVFAFLGGIGRISMWSAAALGRFGGVTALQRNPPRALLRSRSGLPATTTVIQRGPFSLALQEDGSAVGTVAGHPDLAIRVEASGFATLYQQEAGVWVPKLQGMIGKAPGPGFSAMMQPVKTLTPGTATALRPAPGPTIPTGITTGSASLARRPDDHLSPGSQGYRRERIDTTAAKAFGAAQEKTADLSVGPDGWIVHLKSKLSAEELATYEQIHGKMTAEEIKARYGGDLDIGAERVSSATNATGAARALNVASKQRAEEIKSIIESRGLMDDPEIRTIIDDLGPSPKPRRLRDARDKIRSKLISRVLAPEAQARYPGSSVHQDVQIWVASKQSTVAEFNAANPQYHGNLEQMETPKGARIFTEATDLDILVVQPQPSAKARLIHHEEIKTGLKDSQAKANRQLQNGRSLLHEAAEGKTFIRLRENGVDITDTIDMTSGSTVTSATRGPAAKGFDESIGAKARDIQRIIKELVEFELREKQQGISE